MKNEEILQKAIGKAESNGYRFGNPDLLKKVRYIEDEEVWLYKSGAYYASLHQIIFSHDFAKAFWGEEKVDEYGLTQSERELASHGRQGLPGSWGYHNLAWKYNLQQMVVLENPLLYLEGFLAG